MEGLNKPEACVACGSVVTEHFLIAICGHLYCCTCKENNWVYNPGLASAKSRCKADKCEVNLGYETFGWYKHANFVALENNTQSLHKIYAHSRTDFPTLEDYNRYLNEKYERIYQLSIPKEANAATVAVNKFHEEHKESIARINSVSRPTADQQYRDKYDYMAEEYRRLSSRRLRREQHLDDWCCSSHIERERFVEGAMKIEEEEELERQRHRFQISGETKMPGMWFAGNYSGYAQERMTTYQATTKVLKPLKNISLDDYRNVLPNQWKASLNSMTPEERKYFPNQFNCANSSGLKLRKRSSREA